MLIIWKAYTECMSGSYLDNLHAAMARAAESLSRLDELHRRAGKVSHLGPQLAEESREARSEAGAVIRDLAESANFVKDTHPVEVEKAGAFVETLDRRIEWLNDRTRIHGDLNLGTEWNKHLD